MNFVIVFLKFDKSSRTQTPSKTIRRNSIRMYYSELSYLRSKQQINSGLKLEIR